MLTAVKCGFNFKELTFAEFDKSLMNEISCSLAGYVTG